MSGERAQDVVLSREYGKYYAPFQHIRCPKIKLIKQLQSEFCIEPEKAQELVQEKREAIKLQLEYWPYRALKVKNRAWMSHPGHRK